MASVKEFLSKSIKKGFFVYLILTLFLFLHLYLVSKTFVFDDQGNIRTAYSGYGDIPFHMSQVSKFGFGSLFDFNELLFNGTKIKYSFLINYISGIVLKLTDSWTFSMHAPAMVFLAGAYVFLCLIFKNILGTRWAALL